MNEITKNNIHLFYGWSGVAFVVILSFAFIVVADFFPPPSPSLPADEIAEILSGNSAAIKFAMMLTMFAAMFYFLFIVITAKLISKVEGEVGVLTLTYVSSGGFNLIAFSFPAIWWITAVFRSDTLSYVVQFLNDMSWLMFFGFITPTLMIMTVTAVVSFIDKSDVPLFPRWFGCFCLWGVTMFIPGQVIFFFNEGPFSWDGMVGFWVPAIDFYLQFIFTIFFVLRYIYRERREISL